MEKDNKDDSVKIIINKDTPLEYWCTLLSCNKEDLVDAMGVFGNSYVLVDYYLALNRKKKTDK